jgi:hypothetical protein
VTRKIDRRKNRAVGELANHFTVDSAAFMYTLAAPQPSLNKGQGHYGAKKTPKHLFNDAFAPKIQSL